MVGFGPATREFIDRGLKRRGFCVEEAATNAQAADKILRYTPDLIVLNLGAPALPGFKLYQRLRSCSETAELPVLAVSAEGTEPDRALALEAGTADFLVQPFDSTERVARVRALLRRRDPASGRNPSNRYQRGRLTIDFGTHEVLVEGVRCEVTPREFALLRFLVQHPTRVCSREEILDSVWGRGQAVKPRTVDVHVRHLRQAVERDASKPELILSVRKLGYRFNLEALGVR